MEPAKNLKINPDAFLWKLVDGDVFSWSVLDPLEDASLTVKVKGPVTAESLAVWSTVSEGLSVAKEIALEANGREILPGTVCPKKGRQTFDLPQPVSLTRLTSRIR